MDSGVVLQIIVPILFQSVVTLIGAFFIIQRTQEKIKGEIAFLQKSMEIQKEQINTILEVKLDMIGEAHESLNVRISKLEQFKDDFYSQGLFNALTHPGSHDG